ncbi:MAG: histidinol-phosphatase, partial [Candidatus Desulforudis sp.]|nr:histidinol-phosphatase [Desulforudis sp.]
LFDSLAHPDLLKKFGCRPAGDITALYRETVAAIAAAGVCVEVSTAGLRAPVGEIYPHPDFLRLCRDYGVPVTLGSDAHAPEQVGDRFYEAVALLKQVGYREVTTFRRRRRIPFPI